MRRTLTMLLAAVTLLLGLTPVALPVAAAPAEPYEYSNCDDWGGGYELCTTSKGVVKENETRSGNTQFHLTGTFCYALTGPTGEAIDEGCRKINTVLHQKDGETQVYHDQYDSKTAFTIGGTRYECTYGYNTIYANGEFRHDDFWSECNPPL